MRVQVVNDRGSVTLTARITTDIIPGTVLAPGIWWAKHSRDGRNINQVTPQNETDMGGGATFYDTHVWVMPVIAVVDAEDAAQPIEAQPILGD
jgi:anaerobic selenocysteine-containing dehydrogenase